MNHSGRRTDIDIMKGLAIILVVWEHVLANTCGMYSRYISSVHMPVFFFVSGYFLYSELEKNSFGSFTRKKFKRLVIPYIIWSGISFAANTAMMLLKSSADFQNIFREFCDIFLFSRSVWFLIELFIALVITAACYYLLEKRGKTKCLPAVLFIVWAVLCLTPVDELFAYYKFKWCFPFLVTGLWIGMGHGEWIRKPQVYLAGLIPLSVAAVCIGINGFTAADIADPFRALSLKSLSLYRAADCLRVELFGLLGVSGVICISELLNKVGLTRKLFSAIGRYSLDIYVVHMLLIYFFRLIPAPEWNTDVWALACLGIAIVISCGIAIVSKFVLRRFKIYRISTGLP